MTGKEEEGVKIREETGTTTEKNRRRKEDHQTL